MIVDQKAYRVCNSLGRRDVTTNPKGTMKPNNYFKGVVTARDVKTGKTYTAAAHFVPFDSTVPTDIEGAYAQLLAWAASRPGAKLSVARVVYQGGPWSGLDIVGVTRRISDPTLDGVSHAEDAAAAANEPAELALVE